MFPLLIQNNQIRILYLNSRESGRKISGSAFSGPVRIKFVAANLKNIQGRKNRKKKEEDVENKKKHNDVRVTTQKKIIDKVEAQQKRNN